MSKQGFKTLQTGSGHPVQEDEGVLGGSPANCSHAVPTGSECAVQPVVGTWHCVVLLHWRLDKLHAVCLANPGAQAIALAKEGAPVSHAAFWVAYHVHIDLGMTPYSLLNVHIPLVCCWLLACMPLVREFSW